MNEFYLVLGIYIVLSYLLGTSLLLTKGVLFGIKRKLQFDAADLAGPYVSLPVAEQMKTSSV